MFVKKVKYKNTTYYYLMRRVPGTNDQEQLSILGSVDNESAYKEEDLVRNWVISLLSGGEKKRQEYLEFRKNISKTRIRDLGKCFDLEKCLFELKAIHKKYGHLSKQLLEKKARPNGDLSWGTTTLLNQLRNRGISLAQAFEHAKQI